MLFHRSSARSTRPGVRIWTSLSLLTLLAALAGMLVLAGCGGSGSDDNKDGLVLAQVGDKEITGAYYESRLRLLEPNELPKDDEGNFLDMADLAGKNAFLTILINKELMARKATQLGYAADPQIAGLSSAMTAYEAGLQLWRDVIGEPTSVVTPEQLEAFYARMGEVRDCNYLLTNFLKDAEAARQMAQEGADWDDVVARYHEGAEAPTGKYEISIPYGRYNTDFDTDIFETEVGDVAPPIETNYGYWVMRVNNVRDTGKPALEEAKAQILDIARNREIGRVRKEFIDAVHEKYHLFIDEDVLWLAYQGLPDQEAMLDPTTNQPVPKDQLKQLDIKPADMSRIFYGYRLDGDLKEFTLGDYKGHFDRMSVFQRPKREQMMAGMREKITQELDKALLDKEAQARGFYEHPEVVAKVQSKVEETMVTKLYDEIVTFDDKISAEQLDEFWAAHEADYFIPEARAGRLVICRDQENAVAARELALTDVKWKKVLTTYGVDRDNKAQSGKLEKIYESYAGPVPTALFALTEGEVSAPIALEDGRYAVVRLDSIVPGYQQELKDITETVGQRMRNLRKEEAFQALLNQWSEEFGVTRFEENLQGVASWQELTTVEAPGEVIPRD